MNVSSTDFHLVRITLGTADLRPQLWHSGPAPRKRAMESPRQASRFLFFFSQRATIPVGRHCKNKSRTLQARREPGIARSRPLAAAIRATSCSRRREARSLFVRFYHPPFSLPLYTRREKAPVCERERARPKKSNFCNNALHESSSDSDLHTVCLIYTAHGVRVSTYRFRRLTPTFPVFFPW